MRKRSYVLIGASLLLLALAAYLSVLVLQAPAASG
jgi:hypothetical protein